MVGDNAEDTTAYIVMIDPARKSDGASYIVMALYINVHKNNGHSKGGS